MSNETKCKPLESVYGGISRKVLGRLNEISPSMCLAKWYNVSIHLTTGRTHSCYHPPSHEIPLEELGKDPNALHNTSFKKQVRAQMLKGERPSECRYCWDIEENSQASRHLSDRAYRSADVFTEELLQEAVQMGATGDPIPRYMEVNFNQSCNFKCSYCSPHLSSAWFKEVKDFGPYRQLDGHHNDPAGLSEMRLMPDSEKSKKYVEAFWKWWPQVYPHLKSFRMTGGEPLMDKNTFRVFEYVSHHPKVDLELALTSNCCPPATQWEKFISNVKNMADKQAFGNFMLFCSLDSWGEQAEYIRNGMDFNRLYRNICRFLEETEKTSLTFIVTFNNLSVVGWKKYLEEILALRERFSVKRQRVWFDTPMLHSPRWMSLRTLPSPYLELMDETLQFMERNMETPERKFKGFKDFEWDRLKRVRAWMKETIPSAQLQRDRADFHLYFKEHDRRRGTNLRSAFPEMGEFFDLCERESSQLL